MKIILDCNVIIGAGCKPGGKCYRAIREVLLNHQCFVSEGILAEYRVTVNKPKFRKENEALAIILNNSPATWRIFLSLITEPSGFCGPMSFYPCTGNKGFPIVFPCTVRREL